MKECAIQDGCGRLSSLRVPLAMRWEKKCESAVKVEGGNSSWRLKGKNDVSMGIAGAGAKKQAKKSRLNRLEQISIGIRGGKNPC